MLSFAMDDDEEPEPELKSKPPVKEDTPELADDLPPSKRTKLNKNPDVDTSFLPDREREAAEREERETLRQEWLTRQDTLKQEDIEIVYSYWDGSGHRKAVTVSLLSSRSLL